MAISTPPLLKRKFPALFTLIGGEVLTMKRLGLLLVSALVITSPALQVSASVAEPTTATYLILPTGIQAQVSSSGNSTTIPAVIQDFVHPEARRDADHWYWDEGTKFGVRTLVFGGWSKGRLINALHLTIDGNRLTFVRQYRLNYSTLADGAESVTVERFNVNGLKEELDGHTQYTSKVVGNKHYLLTAERVGTNTAAHHKLMFSWSASGVTPLLVHEDGTREALDLAASLPWLKQNFDLWLDCAYRNLKP